jgi:hypothetical protein
MSATSIPLIAWSATAGDVAMLHLKISPRARFKAVFNPMASAQAMLEAGKAIRQASCRSAKTSGQAVRRWR